MFLMLSVSSYSLTPSPSSPIIPLSRPSSSSSASNLPPSSCFIPELQGSPPPSIPHCLLSFSFCFFSFSCPPFSSLFRRLYSHTIALYSDCRGVSPLSTPPPKVVRR
ncbi:hypothetical protein BP00DRAFT_27718 [Aspergillus indologenus CBS 114.80]|uniref:Uncharacterized protein n=1 Tax=Aspergillus indologenus CBS 114.80 TaxID=1450541 RepID=A0A2V5JFH4_9EURO|nr:hypothetical protein BP00DRAFT_27718 [Aspergillus indologenus CBS 114.80]